MVARRLFPCLGAALLATAVITSVQAQDSKSAPLVKELTDLMQQRKLDSVAARHPAADDQFVAALYFPGQLLLVTARSVAPAVVNEKLIRGEFRDVYIDLNSASIPESRVMISDGGADGLRPRREPNEPFDTHDADSQSIRFDGNWREDRMSEKDYMARFAAAEEAYLAALTALIMELKKTS
ncbi:MAG TPA: hypothetical protein VMO26_25915 [Vicinamibacterales bacterium]|nr:hypothetical protein [Vicinamibacterales bacterium]